MFLSPSKIFLLCTFKNSNFCKFCKVIRTQPISVLKSFLLYKLQLQVSANYSFRPKPGFGRSLKVAFFQKVWFVFQISKSPKNIPKHYPELEIWMSCLLLWVGNSNSQFWILIWRSDKQFPLSEKKTFMISRNLVIPVNSHF